MRIMLDTMIYDAIVANPETIELVRSLTTNRKCEILTTHIQKDQLAEIPGDQKRCAALSIPTKKVPTSGAVWDLSKWDECTWVSTETVASIENLTKGNPKHAADALIGATSLSVADVLVTMDKTLAARVKASDPTMKVLDFEGFLNLIRSL